uniref:Uncharacterized protein n=1 Tax=Avena sativa TaxID=4498 RepID=A0ACD5VVD4_AVESA
MILVVVSREITELTSCSLRLAPLYIYIEREPAISLEKEELIRFQMELLPWTSFLAIVVATTTTTMLFVKMAFLRRRCVYNLPPGPKPWPIIGNLHLIGKLPHHSTHELSKRYGPLMYLRFGSFPAVVGSSVEMAKFFLKTQDLMFIDRPKMAAGRYTGYNYHSITWTPYGARWRLARKIVLNELFNAKRLESYEYIRREEMGAFLCGLYEASGGVVKLKDKMATMTLNIIMRKALGKKYMDKVARDERHAMIMTRPEEFKWMIVEFFYLNGVPDIGDSIPWLAWLDMKGYIKRMKKLGKMFDRFLEHVVEEHSRRRRETKNWVAMDMVDVLLQLESDNPSLEVKLTREDIKGITLDMIVGSTDTSALTVEWAMSEILKQRRPDVFAKATEELERVIGRGRWVSEKDIPSLPYIGAIVKETMRMHPGTPMLAPRLSREDASVGGYDIPAGTRVFVNPKLWDAPEEFMPERFLGSKMDIKGQDYELLPFGSGRRMCPGYSLGLRVVQVALANLLHGFTWRLPAGGMTKDELSMEEIFGLTTPRKFPLEVVFHPKLPAHLYAQDEN